MRRHDTATVPRLPALAATLLAALALGACGGDEEAPEPSAGAPATSAGDQPAEGRADRDEAAERAGSGDGGASVDAGTSSAPAESEGSTSASESCPDVAIETHSGNGLFEIETRGLACADATAALKRWGEAGYPGGGPEGFDCESAGEIALRCTERSSGGVVEFETGI